MPITTRKERVGERLTLRDHFPNLLLAAYYWRYLTADQVQRLFSGCYPTATTTTAKRHLRELVTLGLLKVSRPSQNHPNTYSVTGKARRLLFDHFPSQTILATREEASRTNQLEHELALSDLHTSLHLAIASHPDLTALHYERRYFHADNQLTYRTDRGEQLSRVEPDLGVTLYVTSSNRQYPQLHFFELDMGTESPTAFYRKLLAYTAWYEQTGESYLVNRYQQLGDEYPQPAFRLLVVVTNRHQRSEEDRLRTLYQQAEQLPAVIRSRVWFTTQAATIGKQGSTLLTTPIWYPTRQTSTKPRSLFRES